MEELVLLGGFIAIAVFGYHVMSKLDNWLGEYRIEKDVHENLSRLQIAISSPDAIPSIIAAINTVGNQYPDVQYRLSFGQENLIIAAFVKGEMDAAIVSSEAEIPSHSQCSSITSFSQPLYISDGTVEVSTLAGSHQEQKIFWKTGDTRPCMLELIRQLGGRQA